MAGLPLLAPLLVLVLAGCLAPSPSPSPTASPAIIAAVPAGEVGSSIGQLAPDFELESVREPGKTFKLSDYKGRKPVVVNFWASWCTPCREEMPLLDRAYRAAVGSFEILGVNLQEDRSAALAFMRELNVSFPGLLDPDARVKRAYNVVTQPVTFFIDREGVIRGKKLGFLIEEEFKQKMLAIGIDVSARAPGEEVKVTAGVKHLVPLEKITCGLGACPETCSSVACARDRIPAIDTPKFETSQQASAWLKDDDLVLGLVHKGEARAYPIRILNWHEIVNDVVQGDLIAITFCPLCASGVAFDGRLNGRELSFGTSGTLFNSDLVMYDRQTASLWPQIRGQAVVGELTPARLTRLPLDTTTWKEWRTAHADSKVLSRDTGFTRDYDRDPYAGYEKTESVWFPIEYEDKRLPAKEIVFGLFLDKQAKAYREADLKEKVVINDEFAGIPVVVWREPSSGKIRGFDRRVGARTLEFEFRGNAFKDKQTGSTWSMDGLASAGELKGGQLQGLGADRATWMDRAFWFAWAAFFPGTAIYGR